MWANNFVVLHSLDESMNLWVGFDDFEVIDFVLEGGTGETSGSLKHNDHVNVDHHWVLVFVHETMWTFVFGDDLFTLDQEVFVTIFFLIGREIVDVSSVESHDSKFVKLLHKKSVFTSLHASGEISFGFGLMWPKWKTLSLRCKVRGHLHQDS